MLAALALYALPFFWQALTSVRPDAELLPLSHLLPSRLTAVHYSVGAAAEPACRARCGNSLGDRALEHRCSRWCSARLAAYALARLPVPGHGR